MSRKTLSALLTLVILMSLVLAACGSTEECPECPSVDCPEVDCPACPEVGQDILGTVMDRGKVIEMHFARSRGCESGRMLLVLSAAAITLPSFSASRRLWMRTRRRGSG